jgi:hypothetical protein
MMLVDLASPRPLPNDPGAHIGVGGRGEAHRTLRRRAESPSAPGHGKPAQGAETSR